MSWLSDAWDSVSSVVNPNDRGVTDWFGENKGWLQPVAKVVTGALNQNNIDNTQDLYTQYLREKEMRNYQNYVDQATLYNSQLGQGGGGRGGGGAAAANQAAAMAASKKADRKMQQTYRQLLEMYKPYRDVADRLLPQKTQAYENSLGLMSTMNDYVKDPKQMALLNSSIPAYQVNVPLPDSVRIK